MYVSYYCKNQISVRQISSKTRVGEREVAFPSSRNPKFSRGACPQSLLGGSWLPPPQIFTSSYVPDHSFVCNDCPTYSLGYFRYPSYGKYQTNSPFRSSKKYWCRTRLQWHCIGRSLERHLFCCQITAHNAIRDAFGTSLSMNFGKAN